MKNAILDLLYVFVLLSYSSCATTKNNKNYIIYETPKYNILHKEDETFSHIDLIKEYRNFSLETRIKDISLNHIKMWNAVGLIFDYYNNGISPCAPSLSHDPYITFNAKNVTLYQALDEMCKKSGWHYWDIENYRISFYDSQKTIIKKFNSTVSTTYNQFKTYDDYIAYKNKFYAEFKPKLTETMRSKMDGHLLKYRDLAPHKIKNP